MNNDSVDIVTSRPVLGPHHQQNSHTSQLRETNEQNKVCLIKFNAKRVKHSTIAVVFSITNFGNCYRGQFCIIIPQSRVKNLLWLKLCKTKTNKKPKCSARSNQPKTLLPTVTNCKQLPLNNQNKLHVHD